MIETSSKYHTQKVKYQLDGKRRRVAYCNSNKCIRAANKHFNGARVEKVGVTADCCPDCGSYLEYKWKSYVRKEQI